MKLIILVEEGLQLFHKLVILSINNIMQENWMHVATNELNIIDEIFHSKKMYFKGT